MFPCPGKDSDMYSIRMIGLISVLAGGVDFTFVMESELSAIR
jgi:hypothetical protein